MTRVRLWEPLFEEKRMARTHADAIRRICDDLGLPAGDRFTQDWEHELPEQFRTSTWLQRFLVAYSSEGYGLPEKRVLMALLIDCVNDKLEAGDELIEPLWADVAKLLLADREIHSSLIEQWSLPGEPLDDAFAITARVRELMRPPR